MRPMHRINSEFVPEENKIVEKSEDIFDLEERIRFLEKSNFYLIMVYMLLVACFGLHAFSGRV